MRLFSLMLYLLCTLQLVSATDSRPNLVLIMTDDLGWGDVGFNGQKKIKTPHMDALATSGAYFKNFYAASPVCGPSRASLMTGLHQGNCKVRGNPRWAVGGLEDLNESDMGLALELKRGGYSTGLFGKWGLDETPSGTAHPLKRGFDEFWGFRTHMEAHFHWPDYIWHNTEKLVLSEKKGDNWRQKKVYCDDLFTEKALKFIDDKAGKEPFFVFLALTAPHLGISVPEESRKPYENLGWQKKKMRSGHYRNDPEGHSAYAGMVSRIDDQVKMIVDKLKEKGVDKNTLILFTSDNGHEFDRGFFDSNGHFTGSKRWVHEGGLRMPAFAYWPGVIQEGTQVKTSLAFWDVLPTFCELAGIEPSQKHDGISFVEALKGHDAKQKKHDYLYWEFNERQGPKQALRMGKWKVIREYDNKAKKIGRVRLYDLDKDPSESQDVSSSFPEVTAKLTQALDNARSENKRFPLKKRGKN